MTLEFVFVWISLIAILLMTLAVVARVAGDRFGAWWLPSGAIVLWVLATALMHLAGNHHKVVDAVAGVGLGGSILLVGSTAVSNFHSCLKFLRTLKIFDLFFCKVMRQGKGLPWH